MKRSLYAIAGTLAILTPLNFAMAQHAPHAGMQTRSVKALSEQQFADLKAGRGMGLALTAELNGYPGPVHVLELSKELALVVSNASKSKPCSRR